MDVNGSLDLEAFEMSIRSGMHGIGCKMLESILNADDGGHRGVSIPCAAGHYWAVYSHKQVLIKKEDQYVMSSLPVTSVE